MIIFVSGHIDLTPNEFKLHYEPKLRAAIQDGYSFIEFKLVAYGPYTSSITWIDPPLFRKRVFPIPSRNDPRR